MAKHRCRSVFDSTAGALIPDLAVGSKIRLSDHEPTVVIRAGWVGVTGIGPPAGAAAHLLGWQAAAPHV
jgi:hypothetical protein